MIVESIHQFPIPLYLTLRIKDMLFYLICHFHISNRIIAAHLHNSV